jgi:hypothetical protein
MLDHSKSNRAKLLVDGAQVFAGVLAAVALVATTGSRAMALLMIGGSVLLTSIVFQVATHRPWTTVRRILVGGEVAALLAIGTVIVSTDPAESPASYKGGTNSAAEPQVVTSKESYDLTPSYSVMTNDQDKVDLDTACPGWGNQIPRVGPRRCGESADLIADADGIHNANNEPNIVRTQGGGAHDRACQIAIAGSSQLVSQLASNGLSPGDAFCVRTDKSRLALVEIRQLNISSGELMSVSLRFTVWA